MGLTPSRVFRLPDDLVNKIAAGEVVERPASVVKELLENALDARATSVVVDVEGGGRTLIRVRDDGIGMARADAALALERHATSKLHVLDDLQSVATHGFRGEALPSIASVSHLVLQTREDGSPAGTEVEVKDGRLVHVRDAGHPRGTTVEVRDLFGAVPARRKFLRADATETSHVAEAVTLLAVARPEVGFTLRSLKRALVQAPPVSGLAERLFQLFGAPVLDELVPVELADGSVLVRGFVARPTRAASASRPTFRIYVNGRAVRDRAISKAVSEAYRSTGLRDPGGEAFLFVETPLHMVDVNVHPAKTEVRFAEPRLVWTAVERAVRHALNAHRGTVASPLRAGRIVEAAEQGMERASQVAEGREAWGFPGPRAERGALAESSPVLGDERPPVPQTLLDEAPPTVLGQHRNVYIVATDGQEMVLVDQHTAHERVRFEALLDSLAARRTEAQRLLVPAVLSLPASLLPVLEAHQDSLSDLGFEVDGFGGDTVRLSAMPAVLGAREAGRALSAILKDLLERESADWAVYDRKHRAAATLACHSAARAGDALSLPAMKAIVDGLWRATQPALCPHGRPTRVRVPADELSRWFGRTGWRRR